jgi:hypothetical protein
VSLQQKNSKNEKSSILKLKVKSFSKMIEGIEDEITKSMSNMFSNSTYGEEPTLLVESLKLENLLKRFSNLLCDTATTYRSSSL